MKPLDWGRSLGCLTKRVSCVISCTGFMGGLHKATSIYMVPFTNHCVNRIGFSLEEAPARSRFTKRSSLLSILAATGASCEKL